MYTVVNMSCTFSSNEPDSMDLLTDENCIRSLNTFSVRIHDATKRGLHFDYAVGSKSLPFCVDFVIMNKLTDSEILRGDNLPLAGQQKSLKFMPAHDPTSVIFGRRGVWYTIPTGEYGAGKCRITRVGDAKVERVSEHSFVFTLDETSYRVYLPPGFNMYQIRLMKYA